MIPAALKKAAAFGTGVGIQITGPPGAESLHIAAVRVRPGGARLLDSLVIEDFRRQPAAEWGAAYAAFLRKRGLGHCSAVVLLPRADVILRPIPMPGVSNKDLDNAVRFQLDGLHPYGDDDIYASWARLPASGSRGESATVLVAVIRRNVIERYAAPFEEAGVRTGAFTCSAAAIYSALRLFGETPAAELLVVADSGETLEFYGESPTRPLFSASFAAANERASALAAAELRIAPGTEAVPLATLLKARTGPTRRSKRSKTPAEIPAETPGASPEPGSVVRASSSEAGTGPTRRSKRSKTPAEIPAETPGASPEPGSVVPASPSEAGAPESEAPLPLAAALCSACPYSALDLNLLPAERRQAGSRLRWVPSAVLATAVVVLAVWLGIFPAYEKRKYLNSLNRQIAAATPAANRAAAIDKQVDEMRKRIQLLDKVRAQPKADTDVLAELTKLLAPPTWVTMMEVSARQVIVVGETPESAPLLSLLDGSKLFEASEFQGSPTRQQSGLEQFRIKTSREGVK